MKIEVDKQQLYKAITDYETVLIEASEDQIWVSPVGVEGEKIFLPGRRIEVGSAVLQTHELSDLLYKFVDGSIQLHCKGDGLEISGRAVAQMSTLMVPNERMLIAVGDGSLAQRVAFATARKDARTALNMVHLEFANDRITATGINGRCIAQAWLPAEIVAPNDFFISRDGALRLRKIKAGKIYARGKLLQWPGGMFTKTQYGTGWPSLEGLLHAKPTTGVIVDRPAMLKALGTISKESLARCTWSDAALVVTTPDAEITIPLEGCNGPGLTHGLDLKLWTRGLRGTKDDFIFVWLVGPGDPLRIEADNYTYLQMPTLI